MGGSLVITHLARATRATTLHDARRWNLDMEHAPPKPRRKEARWPAIGAHRTLTHARYATPQLVREAKRLRLENCDLRGHNAHLQDDNTRLVHKQNELLLTITALQESRQLKVDALQEKADALQERINTLHESNMKLQEAHIRRLVSGRAAAAETPATAAALPPTTPTAPASPASPAPATTPSRKRKAAGPAPRKHLGAELGLHDGLEELVAEFKQRLGAQTKQRPDGGEDKKYSSSTVQQ